MKLRKSFISNIIGHNTYDESPKISYIYRCKQYPDGDNERVNAFRRFSKEMNC